MLTESREAMHLRKSLQTALRIALRILALASLSSSHFDANPFLNPSGNVPDLPALLTTAQVSYRCRIDGAGVAIV
jgi:hypothetical protein